MSAIYPGLSRFIKGRGVFFFIRRLGLEYAGAAVPSRDVEGIVETFLAWFEAQDRVAIVDGVILLRRDKRLFAFGE